MNDEMKSETVSTDAQLSMLDLLIEVHKGLKRQGPGSADMTRKALSFLNDAQKGANILDLGCGTGVQTLLLAQHGAESVIGLDQMPEFIEVLNKRAEQCEVQERVKGIVGSMEELPFREEEFDIIWSEGAIDAIGFEKGLSYWRSFLKEGGFIAVTCPSWTSAMRPNEVERFWADAGSGLDSIEHNSAYMQKLGFRFVAAFTLPENCWMDNYYIPRTQAERTLREKYPENGTVEAYLEADQREVKLYSRYGQYYGYVFYIGQKI